MNINWDVLKPIFVQSIWETLQMVITTLVVGGFFGLILGVLLYTSRTGGVLENKWIYNILNVVVNFVRPIPFIIFIVAIGPLTLSAVGTTIGTKAAIFALIIAASFGISRIVEQNLISIDPGVVEAAQAMGASPFRIITRVLLPEALGPLILGYTFVFISVVDMTAVAGSVGGGGLGNFAIVYGYQRFNWWVTWLAVLTIIVLVQAAQFFGNWLSNKALRR
ncbi:ABC transporter permease [Mycolicibacterium sp. CH28]|uniref:methionine ABC transporter permease n=1 Tax=Mycolicibacterium sp. CH28 TaxID=2512237 RepID=UPI001081D6E3|nr:methionine ABC transporter permease [Mycolicibacterium sp. CH28]TGD89762.1 ABC transporter permease [Mycolicibacterium sp. CH28]